MPARVQLELSILGPTLENKVWESRAGPRIQSLDSRAGPRNQFGFLGSALEFSRADCKHVCIWLDVMFLQPLIVKVSLFMVDAEYY